MTCTAHTNIIAMLKTSANHSHPLLSPLLPSSLLPFSLLPSPPLPFPLLLSCLLSSHLSDDFTVMPAVLEISSQMQSNFCITINITDDSLVEGDETFTLTWLLDPTAPTGLTLNRNTTVITILDNDGTLECTDNCLLLLFVSHCGIYFWGSSTSTLVMCVFII